MDPIIGASLISGGFDLAGGLFGSKGGGTSVTKSLKLLNAQREYALDDAKRMPSAMVEGARQAGIHPALMFGSGGYQPSPVTVAPMSEGYRSNGIGNALSGLGQNLGRAYLSSKTQDQRTAAINQVAQTDPWTFRINEETWKGAYLDNEIKYLQIRKLANEVPPPLPNPNPGSRPNGVLVGSPSRVPGSQVDKYQVNPSQVTSPNKDIPSVEAGPPAPSMKKYRFGGPNFGFGYELPGGSSVSEGLEALGSIPSSAITVAHNALRSIDSFYNGPPGSQPKYPLPKGYYWKWSPLTRSWKAERR